MAKLFDVVVVGGGIMGLATASEITGRYPGVRLGLLEKEDRLAAHQTGHNSGVIHSGIYYRPGSLKARTCVTGARLLTAFCEAHAIPTERCGKVVVATGPDEVPRLDELYRRGTANGVAGLELIGPERLREIEPYAAGVKALLVPATGIVDYARVAQTYAAQVREQGGDLRLSHHVLRIRRSDGHVVLETSRGAVHTKALINCGGLYADRVARLAGVRPELTIVPFRGEYYTLSPRASPLVNHLLYPVPDPAFPFLGVHFTRRIVGPMEAGPNAVLALAREGYSWRAIVPRDLWETLTFPGFWRLARSYWRTGLSELYRSLSKRAFLRALQRLVPDVTEHDLGPGGSGVRAQAVSRAGALVDDFVITASPQALHVLNAPSPGATASLAIGKLVAERAAAQFWAAG